MNPDAHFTRDLQQALIQLHGIDVASRVSLWGDPGTQAYWQQKANKRGWSIDQILQACALGPAESQEQAEVAR